MNNPEIPRPEELASLRLLEEIEHEPDITQRELSRRVGVSLGLINLLIKRMARKAWIKIKSVPGRRVLYALTPRGLSEKVRKTRDFIRLTLRHQVRMKSTIIEGIRKTGRARPRVASHGAGELRELVAEAVREAGGRYAGPVGDAGSAGVHVVVVMERASKAQRRKWERRNLAVIDFS